MAETSSTFSESWHRVSQQRLYLRPGVRVRRQNYRGERWIVLENPLSNDFYRLRPPAYEFLARLSPDQTVEQVWKECIERFPDDAPGQDAVMELLGQLYHSNLLHYEEAGDTAQLFARFKKRRQREVRGRLLNLMFMRFPLLDPDWFLVRTMPWVGKLITPVAAVLGLVMVGAALKVVIDNFAALQQQSQAALAPQNLPLLYVALVFIKTLHEFGHAYCCRKFGGEVHVMGILLMIFTPVPYMDATSSWGFRSRWKRLLVGAAGMLVELLMAALATFVWAATGPGTVHSLAYNLMLIASVSTVVFNANPLLRFDGYYMLSDLLEIPNLNQRANQQLKFFFERYVFGVKKAEAPARTRKEAGWYVLYGIASGIYRVFVFGGVLLLVADRLLIVGILMGIICLISWVTVPTGKFIHYLAASPRLDRVRFRAVAATAAMVGGVLVLLGIIPFPSHFRAPGVLEARQRAQVVNEVAGSMTKLLAEPGSRVTKGQPLLELNNFELEAQLAGTQGRLNEIQARILWALSDTNADLKPLYSSLEAVTNEFHKLTKDRASLIVRAGQAGVWVAPGIQEFKGRRLVRGTALGLVVDPSAFEFVATVPQADADAAFAKPIRLAEVRIRGQAGNVLPVLYWRVVPGGKQTLPSPALGWAGGGEMPVAASDPTQATEPFFEVCAQLPGSAATAMFHGRSGKIRFDLQPEPLLPRWTRRLFQLLQKRYQL